MPPWDQACLSLYHLCKDATNAPNIHRCGIKLAAQEDLGGTIPQRHHLVGVGAQGNPEGSSQPKVGQLDGSKLIDEQILGLQVPVDDPMRVAEIHSLQELEEVALQKGAGRAS